MDTRKHMIIAKDKIITEKISSCYYNEQNHQYDITFISGQKYSYGYENVIWITDPDKLNPQHYKISYKNKVLSNIQEIYEFRNINYQFWCIFFKNGLLKSYQKSSLKISKSCLCEVNSKKVFSYMKDAAKHISIRTDDGRGHLLNQYEKIDFINEADGLSIYLNPQSCSIEIYPSIKPIFPFGCNASQYIAVKNALCNQLSVIQGPPGTGKTQTILNIIANLIISGKTVQVVSNNNSATANVLEKLSSPEYNLDFIVAMLGNYENKNRFIENQNIHYPSFIQSWDSNILNDPFYLQKLNQQYEQLKYIYEQQECLAKIKIDLQNLKIEFKHFKQYCKETNQLFSDLIIRKKLKAEIFLLLWNDCQKFINAGKKLPFLFKLKCRFIYGIAKWKFYENEIDKIINLFQDQFYINKIMELNRNIEIIEEDLSRSNQNGLVKVLKNMSLTYLQAVLKNRYNKKNHRKIFSPNDLWNKPLEVLEEYPVILSTTHSARNSLSKDTQFDYVIIDEASQVDIVTGVLALSSAKNAVIVGDEKQLPNVITRDVKEKLQATFDNYNISKHYNSAKKSFLQSFCSLLPNVPRTLLREHYRCHPKIINFCNQKFYDGNLLIMTEEKNEKNTISLVKTVIGNHERDRMNQRQIDVVIKEVLPRLEFEDNDIGIIAPYKNQVRAFQNSLSNEKIEVATVHKFQGREKDSIIITTVDNKVTEFSDDPYLLNVAISRAKKNLCIVVSGNEQPKDSNIKDFIDYIEYHNGSQKSSVFSIFDLLYEHYEQHRLAYLKKNRSISDYDSENLMYGLINEVLSKNEFSNFKVICHFPLKMLLKDTTLLNDKERQYALNNKTHIDFLIYNRISKKTVLAIEVDGYHYHKKGTVQSERDIKKNRILDLYNIPLLRFRTTGSGEKEILINKLKKLTTHFPL